LLGRRGFAPESKHRNIEHVNSKLLDFIDALLSHREEPIGLSDKVAHILKLLSWTEIQGDLDELKQKAEEAPKEPPKQISKRE
jgi:hypothetical protein